MIGHKYGTHSDKTREIYVDLDKRLADLFGYLDQNVGKDQYLVFLMADHGAANSILLSREHGIPADGFVVPKVEKELDAYLMNKFGSKTSLVRCIDSYKVFINHEAVEAMAVSLDDVKKAAIEWLKKTRCLLMWLTLSTCRMQRFLHLSARRLSTDTTACAAATYN